MLPAHNSKFGAVLADLSGEKIHLFSQRLAKQLRL
jgi:hypothetical protein